MKAERKDLQNDLLRIRGSVPEVSKYLPPALWGQVLTDVGAWRLVMNQVDRLPFSSKGVGDWGQWNPGHAHINT